MLATSFTLPAMIVCVFFTAVSEGYSPRRSGACLAVLCPITCPSGYLTDPATGCPTCTCRKQPALSVDTGSHSSKVCRQCPPNCFTGFVIGWNGCRTCICRRPLIDPGFVGPTCRPAPCRNFCIFGRQLDSNGCETCQCNYHPRATPTPRPPQCSRRLCRNYCINGRQLNRNGCETCRCKPLAGVDRRPDQQPSLNGPLQIRCPQVTCSNNCPKGLWAVDREGCPTCQCQQQSNGSVINWERK